MIIDTLERLLLLFSGNAMWGNYGQQFTTTDRNNDGTSSRNCAEERGRGGWWYQNCGTANLNGVYHHTPNTTDLTGIYWWHWHRSYYSLKATTMMIQKT